jgi:hypothetical protein
MRDRHLQHLYAEIPNLATDAAQRVGTLLSDECDLALKRENHNSRLALLALVTFLLIICTWAFHTKLMTGSLAASANRSLEADQFHRKEIGMRFNSQIGVAAGVAAMSIAVNACAQTAVEWRVEDGGNGHWYEGWRLSAESYISWNYARGQALQRGGDLVSLSTPEEASWVFENVANDSSLWSLTVGPWVGGFQSAGAAEPSGGWSWLDGSVLYDGFPWVVSQPDNATYCGGPGGAPENHVCYWFGEGVPTPANRFTDLVESGYCVARAENDWVTSAVIEWSADCNNDGLIDYGQILAGDLNDANANNIPDCCEGSASCDPCPADIVHDGFVNAIDLAAVLNNWGSAGGKINADANDDGLVDAQDLAIVLSAWGACE